MVLIKFKNTEKLRKHIEDFIMNNVLNMSNVDEFRNLLLEYLLRVQPRFDNNNEEINDFSDYIKDDIY